MRARRSRATCRSERPARAAAARPPRRARLAGEVSLTSRIAGELELRNRPIGRGPLGGDDERFAAEVVSELVADRPNRGAREEDRARRAARAQRRPDVGDRDRRRGEHLPSELRVAVVSETAVDDRGQGRPVAGALLGGADLGGRDAAERLDVTLERGRIEEREASPSGRELLERRPQCAPRGEGATGDDDVVAGGDREDVAAGARLPVAVVDRDRPSSDGELELRLLGRLPLAGRDPRARREDPLVEVLTAPIGLRARRVGVLERLEARRRPMRRGDAPGLAVVGVGLRRSRPLEEEDARRVGVVELRDRGVAVLDQEGRAAVAGGRDEDELRRAALEHRRRDRAVDDVARDSPSLIDEGERDRGADAAVQGRGGEPPSRAVDELDRLLAVRAADGDAERLLERARGRRPDPRRGASQVRDVEDLLRLVEKIGGADPPAAETAGEDRFARLTRDGEDHAAPAERAVGAMLEDALERVALPRSELVAEVAADPAGGLGAIGADDVGGSGSFQTRRDELDRLRRFWGFCRGFFGRR